MTRKERREAQQAPFKARAAEEAAQEAAEVQARKEAAGHIITLDDIMANNNLQPCRCASPNLGANRLPRRGGAHDVAGSRLAPGI